MKTETIVYVVIIVLLIGVTIRLATNEGKMENYELVNWNNSRKMQDALEHRFNYPGDKNIFGNYPIPKEDWFRKKCDKYGEEGPYWGSVGCEDSMKSQRENGVCKTLYCNGGANSMKYIAKRYNS
jgi:hypothetical protein